ncbi:hypothetical protein J6TS2_22610 [Heyndrickxia sporothermodurans]|nr:hypothetical protein J6TS2_22610 [Heyndrickxia sporothermodurans]
MIKKQLGDVIKQHVYKLTIDHEHEVIDIYINRQSTPIDNVTSL